MFLFSGWSVVSCDLKVYCVSVCVCVCVVYMYILYMCVLVGVYTCVYTLEGETNPSFLMHCFLASEGVEQLFKPRVYNILLFKLIAMPLMPSPCVCVCVCVCVRERERDAKGSSRHNIHVHVH